jgi:hypothetical protein
MAATRAVSFLIGCNNLLSIFSAKAQLLLRLQLQVAQVHGSLSQAVVGLLEVKDWRVWVRVHSLLPHQWL